MATTQKKQTQERKRTISAEENITCQGLGAIRSHSQGQPFLPIINSSNQDQKYNLFGQLRQLSTKEGEKKKGGRDQLLNEGRR